MDQHGWKKIGTVSSSALDGVWCTMRSNHSYRCWHPSQFINVFVGEVDPLLHNQPIKWITSILTTQYYKMAHRWMNENRHTSCSCMGWCVMYHELQPSMQALAPLSIYLWVHVWGWYTIAQVTKQGGHIHTGHTILQGWTSMDERILEHFHPLPWIVDEFFPCVGHLL